MDKNTANMTTYNDYLCLTFPPNRTELRAVVAY